MNALILVCVCVTYVVGIDLDLTWQDYKVKYDKVYDEAENEARKIIYLENMETVRKHNLEAERGRHSYLLGPTKYADMTNVEYRQLLTVRSFERTSGGLYNVTKVQVPDNVDWRTSGFVGPVRDQGECGSSDLYTTLDCVQFKEINIFKSPVSLSEEQLLECCLVPCSCTGGSGYLQCLVNLGGIASDSTYPQRKCQSCEYKPEMAALSVTGQQTVPSGDEVKLKEAVANLGLFATAIDASNFSFQLYAGGIYDEPSCSSTMLDHSVVIVGYGSENGKDYWIVRNSWGINWGEDGYIRMSRNKQNQCGIATQAVIPLVQKPN